MLALLNPFKRVALEQMALLELNEEKTDVAIDTEEDISGQYSPNYIAKTLRLGKKQADRNLVRIASLLAQKKKTAELNAQSQKQWLIKNTIVQDINVHHDL